MGRYLRAGTMKSGTEYGQAKIGAIIIARDQSVRCPGKALADICGKPALYQMVERLRHANYLHDVIVATTEDSSRIIELCQSLDISYSVGSVDDILDRTYQCAKEHSLDIILRSWGDCILIDPFLANEVINDHLSFGYDYTYMTGYPKGLNCAVLTFDVLKHVWETIKEPQWRAWFQRWCCQNMKAREFGYIKSLDSISWCVDYPEDLEFVRATFRELGDHVFTWGEVLDLWLKLNPLKI